MPRPETFQSNNSEELKPPVPENIKCVTRNTAIVVVHGIGNQLPMETLDQLGRGLVGQYRQVLGDKMQLSHEIVFRTADVTKEGWFDNVLRISNKDSPYYIDVYEYYWANYTQDKASWKDLNTWLQGVVSGAGSFYKRNASLGD